MNKDGSCSMDERTLSGTQCLDFTLTMQEALVKKLHQLIGRVVFHRPEAHHQGIGPSSQECPSQAQLLVTTAAQGQPRFAATQGNQFAALQIEAEGVNCIELSIGKKNRRKIGGIQPAMAVSRQVNDRTTWRLLDEPGDSSLIFKIAATIQHDGHSPRLFE